METGLWVALGAGFVVLLTLLCLLAIVVVSGRRTQRALVASRADIESLQTRLEALSVEIVSSRRAAVAPPRPPQPGYLITSAGATTEAVANRVVLSATVGEPLVKLVALGHGVRRALAAPVRNRIAFEMKREVKRARKQRKRDLREARRSVPVDSGPVDSPPGRPGAEAAA